MINPLSIKMCKPLFVVSLLVCTAITFSADPNAALTSESIAIQESAVVTIEQSSLPLTIEDYRSILKLAPVGSDALKAQASIVRLHLKAGEVEDAQSSILELKQNYAGLPDYAKCAHELGWDFVMSKDYDTSVQIYTDLQKQFPKHERAAWFQRSIVQTYLEKGDLDQAVTAAEELKQNYKNHKDYRNQLNETAERFRWERHYAEAMRLCDYLLETYPDCDETAAIYCTKIKVLLNTDKLQDAGKQVDLLVAGKARKIDVQPIHELGWEFVKRKDYDSAVEMYAFLKQQFPKHERAAWFQRSIVQTYLEKGDLDQAVTAAEELKQNYKNHKDYRNQLNETAERFRWERHYAEAMRLCDYLLETYPDCDETAAIHCTKIKVLLNTDKLQDAGKQVDLLVAGKAREIDVQLIHELGWEFVKRKDYDSAVEMYASLKQQFPKHERAAWFQRSIVQTYLEKGDMAKVDEEIEVLKADYKECSDYIRQLHETAVRLRGKRAYDKAEAVYAYALTEDSECDEAAMLKRSQIQTLLEMDKRQEAKAGVRELPLYQDRSDYVKQVHELGWEFVIRGDYDTGLKIYTDLKNQYPCHERAGWFRRSIAQTYLKQGNQANLLKAIEDMKANFQNNDDYIHHMEYVSDRLMDAGKYDLAQGIISFIQANEEQVDIWALNQKIRADLGSQEVDSADASLKQIHTEFSDHKDYHNVLCWVAGAYRDHGAYDKAVALYELALSMDTDDGISLRCDEGLARAYARMGEDAKVQEQIDLIHETYARQNPKGVTFHFYGVGEEYYLMAQEAANKHQADTAKACYEKAIGAWARQLEYMPESNNADYVYHIAICYQRIDNFSEAIDYYQQLVGNWPAYEKAWHAQYQIAKIYEYLTGQGTASSADVRSAYQQLLERYPDCSVAEIALKKLNTL